ncbi:ABC transporter substrate-binding protein [Mesobacterium pallidum]|uniref:ABC transporter substrate-binding protein n=1 Tax=Mesobacterium pallidum TaxID=2872037 RepID=UPI001EE27015|nr:ABC transporter substrate-binding protein [Mesobacterium pallidum]
MFETATSALRSALSAAAIVTLAGAGTAFAQDFPELTVTLATDDNVFNPTTSSVFQLAQDLGFFDKHEVKVNFIGLDGTPLAAAALQSGDVDVAHISIDAAIRLDAGNDLPVRGFLSVGAAIPFLIAAKSEIASLEDLEGHSFAISDIGGLDHALTQAVLRSYGLDPDLPDYVAIGAPSVRVQALAVKRVDATTVSFGTFAAVEDTPGLHVLLPADAFAARAPALPKFLVVREDNIDAKREALQRFTDAVMDASREFAADPEHWIDAAVERRPDLSRDSIEKTARLNSTMWCVNGCLRPDTLKASMDFAYSNPDFSDVPVIGVDDLIDFSFTDAALEKMGVAETTGLDSRN